MKTADIFMTIYAPQIDTPGVRTAPCHQHWQTSGHLKISVRCLASVQERMESIAIFEVDAKGMITECRL